MDRTDANPAALEARTRRAYETGRLASALLRSALLLPVVLLSLSCCNEPLGILVSGAGLIGAVAFCLWRGGAWRRGVRPGLLAGSVPMLAPVALQTAHLCIGGVCLLTSTVCVLAGLAGGIALGIFAPRPRELGGVPLFAASLIAGFAGSVGCLLYGLIGVGGMALGLLAGATPVLAVRRLR